MVPQNLQWLLTEIQTFPLSLRPGLMPLATAPATVPHTCPSSGVLFGFLATPGILQPLPTTLHMVASYSSLGLSKQPCSQGGLP